MPRHPSHPSRRHFITKTGSTIATFALANPAKWALAAGRNERLKVAAVFTEFTYRSHAHVILENFLEPYLFNGKLTDPGMDVVSFYADQTPEKEMSKTVAADYGIPIYNTITEALCLGGKELAVDAVLSIGEHGKYPRNDLGQHLYPRKRFFDEIVAVMKRSNRFVLLFNDKHLSYRWDWAKEMYDTTVKHNLPFMAGSSVPLAQRIPPLEIPTGAEIEEAVSIHGGGVESYDFHALEVLQSMIEARKGGETGVSRVQFLDNTALWKAAEQGRWSPDLAKAAVETELDQKLDHLRDLETSRRKPHGVLVEYKDGLKGVIINLAIDGTHWNFACKRKGQKEPLATSFYVGPWDNRNLFKALSHAIQHHFKTGKAPYPVERTLLVSGILDAEMHSRHQGGQPLDTPQLEFAYDAKDFRRFREMGQSWKIITMDTPQPPGIHNTSKR